MVPAGQMLSDGYLSGSSVTTSIRATPSAATMRITVKTAEEVLKVRPSLAQFIVPLGATMNMGGTALYQALATEGIEAAARLGPIRAVQEVDRALSTLLAVVGLIGIVAAFSAMAANLVSMVERKRKEIALLRMMGLRRSGAFALPVAAAIYIAGAAALAACLAYAAASAPINALLSEALPFGDRISRLTMSDMGLATIAACFGAAICAVFAARRAARVEPATALRRE